MQALHTLGFSSGTGLIDISEEEIQNKFSLKMQQVCLSVGQDNIISISPPIVPFISCERSVPSASEEGKHNLKCVGVAFFLIISLFSVPPPPAAGSSQHDE